jgi:CRISPR-associated protein Cmr4
MKITMMGLVAETSLHPGAEGTGGVIDLPVAREGDKGYPVIPGSSMKGALRDKAEQELVEKNTIVSKVFGGPDQAGGIAVTDARILLLPMRSLTSHYRWVTCPYLLERFQRDLKLMGCDSKFNFGEKGKPVKGEAIAVKGDSLYLEEFSFKLVPNPDAIRTVIDGIKQLVYHNSLKERLNDQMVIISDDDFSYFSQYGLQVNARNVLEKETKASINLWYEELIPSDTLFYSLLIARKGQEKDIGHVKGLFVKSPYLQVGGNETIGQGWCVVSCFEGGEKS